MAEYEVYEEMTWNCPNCNTTQLGRNINCQGCGQAREDVEFDDAENSVVTDQEQLAVAKGGADWICGHCDTSNRNGNLSCMQCGAGKSEGKSRAAESAPKTKPPKVKQAKHVERVVFPDQSSTSYRENYYEPSVTPSSGAAALLGLLGGLAGITFLIWLIWFCFFDSKNVHLTLKQVAWSRSISLQQYIPVEHDGWSAPVGSTILKSWSALHHTDTVQTGTKTVQVSKKVKSGSHKELVRTENLKNGFKKKIYKDVDDYETIKVPEEKPVYKDVPVYRTKYRYTVLEWCTGRSVPTAGNDVKPYWGEVRLASNEREDDRSEDYEGVFEELVDKVIYKKSFQSAEFVQLVPGGLYEADVTRAGGMSNLRKLAE